MSLPTGGPFECGIVAISTTFGSRGEAVACGERLVARRLAACVQVDGPMTSTYRWRAAVETSEEWRCTCKTTIGRRDECVAAIVGEHPYETPQVTLVAVEATPAYAAWVRESVEAP